MRYLSFFFRLTLFSLFCVVAAAPIYGQDPVKEAQKYAEEAKKQQAKAEEAAKKIDCEKPKASDKKALVDAVNKAQDAAKSARGEADKAKAAAEEAGKAADRNPKSKKAQDAKTKADTAAKDADAAAKEAETAAAGAMERAPGMAAADAIEKALDKTDVSGNSKKKDAVDRLKKVAKAAGDANPCDPEEVKRIIRVELEDIKDEYKGNKTLTDWLKTLGDTLKNQTLIFFQAPGADALVFTATGTGRTTGHIADLSVFNPTDQPATVTLGACFIPSSGSYQPYIVPNVPPITVAPHSTANVPLKGYCADVFIAPAPAGAALPPVNTWAIDPATHPNGAATELLEAVNNITTAYDNMHNSGAIATPFSGNPEKERESVIQQTLWIYAAALSGREYTVSDFRDNTIRQFETSTGQSFAKTPATQQKQIEQGVQDFWNTFQAVGAEAKVLKTQR